MGVRSSKCLIAANSSGGRPSIDSIVLQPRPLAPIAGPDLPFDLMPSRSPYFSTSVLETNGSMSWAPKSFSAERTNP